MKLPEFTGTGPRRFNVLRSLVEFNRWWTKIPIEQDRYFIYGPSLNRLYLLNLEKCQDALLQWLLGLKKFRYTEALADPALEVLHQAFDLEKSDPTKLPVLLPICYRMLFVLGKAVPILWLTRCVGLMARYRRPRLRLTLTEIGATVYQVERNLHFSSCYPRALLTAFLCLSNDHPCDLIIGSLSPTKLMHAWCCSNGKLPYELQAEHYLYQPLIMISMKP